MLKIKLINQRFPRIKMQQGGRYPVVGSNGIIGWHDKYTTEVPSITIGRSGNVGKPFLFNGRSWSHNTTLYIKEYKNVSSIFIYYLLKTLDLGNYAGGSAVPTLNRNHIHTLEVSVPTTIEEQDKIVSVLRLIDDKIELNNAINDNLEAQKSILETVNLPDISLGSKLSLIAVKTLLSLTFSIISVNKGVTKSLNLLMSTVFGMMIGIFLSSVKLIYFCVLPAKHFSIC